MIRFVVETRDKQEIAVDAAEGVSLMEAIRDGGGDELAAICGGCLSCATCHVHIDAAPEGALPPMSQEENDLLDASPHRNASSRLSCQITLVPALDGLRVRIAAED